MALFPHSRELTGLPCRKDLLLALSCREVEEVGSLMALVLFESSLTLLAGQSSAVSSELVLVLGRQWKSTKGNSWRPLLQSDSFLNQVDPRKVL